MSKKYDAYPQVRLDPDVVQKVDGFRVVHPKKPTRAKAVNGMIRALPANRITIKGPKE